MAYLLALRSAHPDDVDTRKRRIIEARDADTYSAHERTLFQVVNRPTMDAPSFTDGLALNADDPGGALL